MIFYFIFSLFSSIVVAFDFSRLQEIMNAINCTVPECFACERTIVACDDNENIVKLTFDGVNNLNGSFSERINELTHLTQLSARSFITNSNLGILPNLKNLIDLEVLDLANQFLHGTIFTEIGLLTKLTVLRISGVVTGLIPTQINLLSNLERLEIRHLTSETRETLFGILPDMKQMPNIEVFIIDGAVDGHITADTCNENLRILHWVRPVGSDRTNAKIDRECFAEMDTAAAVSIQLREVDLGLQLPTELALLNINTLQLFDVLDNSESFPFNVGFLKPDVLTSLVLVGMNMTGSTIPSELGTFTRLSTLTLENCKLSDDVPTEMGLLEQLKTLSLATNSLSGDLQFTRNLQQLTSLNVVNNMFDTLPPRETIERVRQIFLARNEMTGELPRDLQAPNLQTFTASDNMITGEIPPSFASVTTCLFEGNCVIQCLEESVPMVGMCRTNCTNCPTTTNSASTAVTSLTATKETIAVFTTASNTDTASTVAIVDNTTTRMESPESSNTIVFVIIAVAAVVCLLFAGLMYKFVAKSKKENQVDMKNVENSKSSIYAPAPLLPSNYGSSFGNLQ